MPGSAGCSDDVWGDSASEDGQAELKHENEARRQVYHKAGYREGVDLGKERSVQVGFNIGYAEGARAGFDWGLQRGFVKTLEVFVGQVAGTSEVQSEVAALAAQLDVPARAAMLAAYKQVLARPMQASQQALPNTSKLSGHGQGQVKNAAPSETLSEHSGLSHMQGTTLAGRKSSDKREVPVVSADSQPKAQSQAALSLGTQPQDVESIQVLDVEMAAAFTRLAVGDLPGEPFADDGEEGGRPAAMPSSTHGFTLPDMSALQQQVVAGLAALGFHVIAPGARNATEARGVGAGALFQGSS